MHIIMKKLILSCVLILCATQCAANQEKYEETFGSFKKPLNMLMAGIFFTKPSLIKQALKKGADINGTWVPPRYQENPSNAPRDLQKTPLLLAITESSPLLKPIAKMANVNQLSSYQLPPLHYAINTFDSTIVKIMLECGASTEQEYTFNNVYTRPYDYADSLQDKCPITIIKQCISR